MHVHRAEGPLDGVVQRLPAQVVVQAAPGHARPDVIKLPVQDAHRKCLRVRPQPPPAQDRSFVAPGAEQISDLLNWVNKGGDKRMDSGQCLRHGW